MSIEYFYQKPFPDLKLNNKFLLREQQLDDTEAFFNYYTDPQVFQYILANSPKNIQEAESEIYYCRNLFRQSKGIYWTIARKDTNKMVGAIGFYINNFHRRAELSYDLSKDHWSKGIMSQAIQVVCDYAFKSIGLSRIEAITMKENIASQRVLQKAKFQFEGTLRNYKFHQGRPFDVEMFSLIP